MLKAEKTDGNLCTITTSNGKSAIAGSSSTEIILPEKYQDFCFCIFKVRG
jgi:hypothetical protein